MKNKTNVLALSLCVAMLFLLQVSPVTVKASNNIVTSNNTSLLESNEEFLIDGVMIKLTNTEVTNAGSSILGICSKQLPEDVEIKLMVSNDLGNKAMFRLASVEDEILTFLPDNRIQGIKTLTRSKSLDMQIYTRKIVGQKTVTYEKGHELVDIAETTITEFKPATNVISFSCN